MAANLEIRIQADNSSALKGISGVKSAVGGLGSVLGAPVKAAGALTNALGKIGLASMGISAVKDAAAGLGEALGVGLASDINESWNKVQVVFGKSAGQIDAFAKSAGNSLGMSRAEALDTAGTFGNLFKTLGLSEKATTDMSKNVLKLAADLGSFNNLPTADVLEKIRAGLVGESEPLRALGVNLNEAMVAQKAVNMGLAKSTKNVSESAKVQARYALIVEQTSTAQNDFANTSSGMANATKRIQAGISNLKAAIGEKLLPVIAPLVASFADALPGAIDKVMPYLETFGKVVSGIFSGNWTGVLDTIGEQIRTAFGQDALNTFRTVIADVSSILASIKAGDYAGAIGKIWDGVKNIGGGLLGKISEAVQGIKWGEVWAKVTGVAESVTTWLAGVWGGINWLNVWNTAKDVAGKAIGLVLDIGGDVLSWLKGVWGKIDWGQVWGTVKTVVGSVLSTALDIAGDVATWLGGVWASIDWGKVWATATSIGAGLISAAVDITTSITDWLGSQIRGADWAKIWSNIPPVPAPQGGTSSNKSWFQENFPFTSWVAEELGKLITVLPQKMNEIAKQIREGNGLAEAAKNLADSLVGLFTRGIGTSPSWGMNSETLVAPIKSFWENLCSNVNVIAALFEGAAKIIVSFLDGLDRALTGKDAAGHMRDALGVTIESGTNQAKPGATSDGLAVGSAIDGGITSGIYSGVPSIERAARYAAMKARQAAEAELGIRSPSKVFALIGKQMTAGMALGMTQATPQVVGVSQGLAGAAVGGVMRAPSLLSAPAPVAASGGGRAPIVVQINNPTFLTGDRSAADQLANLIAPALARRVAY